MSEQSIVKMHILELLQDGRECSRKEIEDILLEKGVVREENSSALRNALYSLKEKECKIKSKTRGSYRISDGFDCEFTNKDKETEMRSMINVDEMKDILGKLSRELDYLNSVDCRRCSDSENICARQKIRMLDEFKIEFLKKYK